MYITLYAFTIASLAVFGVTMKRRTLILSALASLAITGCATKSIPFDHEKAKQYRSADSVRTCKVTIRRESAFTGAALDTAITIDEDWLATLWSGDEVVLYIAPGKHILIAEMGVLSRTIIINAKPNEEINLFLKQKIDSFEIIIEK